MLGVWLVKREEGARGRQNLPSRARTSTKLRAPTGSLHDRSSGRKDRVGCRIAIAIAIVIAIVMLNVKIEM